MKTINAVNIKQHIDEALKGVLQYPVNIQKQQKDFAVLLSSTRYQELLAFEDKCLHQLATKAEQEGFIGIKASQRLLDTL